MNPESVELTPTPRTRWRRRIRHALITRPQRRLLILLWSGHLEALIAAAIAATAVLLLDVTADGWSWDVLVDVAAAISVAYGGSRLFVRFRRLERGMEVLLGQRRAIRDEVQITVSAADLERLSCSDAIAKALDEYKRAGGKPSD